jgi:hypothetical protein
VNWEDYVVLARILSAYGLEATSRSALSRAYYGAFNLSRQWLEANGASIADHRAHRQVWETFKVAARASEETRRDWVQIGDLGNSLRRLRNQADYEDRVPDLAVVTGQAVLSAERILRLLAGLKVA